jgi:hypothetical protein
VYATACEFFFGEVVSLSHLVETGSTGVRQETSREEISMKREKDKQVRLCQRNRTQQQNWREKTGSKEKREYFPYK